MSIAIVCKPGCDVMNFKVKHLSDQAFFPTRPKGRDKNLNILRTKRVFKAKQKAFFITFKGLSIKQITQRFFGR